MGNSQGQPFGKYHLLKKLAAGGMGEVFLAKLKGPVGFEKILVIKRILQHHIENEEFVDMFFAEARVAAQLNHSNIVQIYEMGQIEDSYFIAMEYIHGKSLRDIIDRARALGEQVPSAHVVDIISKLGAGLSYAHNARDMSGEPLSIIHRDINPHNLLISYSGEVKIIDFGIAKSEMSMHKTETGTIKGKFVYMSPEQSAAEDIDKRSDIFSVGICLYETLTFTNPFAKANVVLSLDAIQRRDPPPVSDTNPRLQVFEPLVDRALAKQREHRYQDCADMRDELLDLLDTGAVPRPNERLAEYMHYLFEEQIEEEKNADYSRDIPDTPRGTRPQDRVSLGRRGSFEAQSNEAALAALSREHSRLPFFLLLFAILASTAIGSVAANRVARRDLGARSAPSSPIPTRDAAVPTPTPLPPSPTAPASQTTRPRVAQNGNSAPANGKLVNTVKPEPKPMPRPVAERLEKAEKLERRAKADRKSKLKSKAPSAKERPAATVVSHGSLQVSTSPPVKITRGGNTVGQTIPRLKTPTGLLVFGNGTDPRTDPFRISVRYKITDGKIAYQLESDPWAIVKKDGIGVGRIPPVKWVDAGNSTSLDFVNPKNRLRMRINLRYNAP